MPQQLLAEVHAVVTQVVRGRTMRPNEVDDLVQDVMLRIVQQFSSWRGDAPVTHWAARIAVNRCIDHQRARIRKPDGQMIADVASRAGNHEDAVAARDLVDHLLGTLSAKDRLIVHLLDLEGWSIAQVAQHTGWSRLAVRLRAHRARAKLRVLATTHAGDPPHG
jgi:RNA polymerase sigma-70 factor (ECF subfamily)